MGVTGVIGVIAGPDPVRFIPGDVAGGISRDEPERRRGVGTAREVADPVLPAGRLDRGVTVAAELVQPTEAGLPGAGDVGRLTGRD